MESIRLFFVAEEVGDDTALIINTPDEDWICSDDYDGVDPLIDVSPGPIGAYDIWVGSFGEDNPVDGTLYVTELSFTPSDYGGGAGSADEGEPGGIFILPGPLGDDEDLGLRVAPIDDDLMAAVAEFAAPAIIGPQSLGELRVSRRRQDGVVLLIEDIDLVADFSSEQATIQADPGHVEQVGSERLAGGQYLLRLLHQVIGQPDVAAELVRDDVERSLENTGNGRDGPGLLAQAPGMRAEGGEVLQHRHAALHEREAVAIG